MQEANENKELCSVHLGQKIKDFSFSTYNPVTDSFEEHSFSEYGLLRKWIILYGSCLAERFFSEHFENEFVNVLVSVVKTKLAFFQMKVKSVFCQAPKAHKSRFCKCPEAFNTINV